MPLVCAFCRRLDGVKAPRLAQQVDRIHYLLNELQIQLALSRIGMVRKADDRSFERLDVAGGEFFPQSGRFKNGSRFSQVAEGQKRPADFSTGLGCY